MLRQKDIPIKSIIAGSVAAGVILVGMVLVMQATQGSFRLVALAILGVIEVPIAIRFNSIFLLLTVPASSLYGAVAYDTHCIPSGGSCPILPFPWGSHSLPFPVFDHTSQRAFSPKVHCSGMESLKVLS